MPEQAQVNIFMELLALLGTFALGLAVGLLVPPVQRFFARLWGSPRSLARGARQAGGRLRDSFRWPSSDQAAEMGGMRGAIAQAVANTLTFRVRRAKTLFLEGQVAYQAGRLADAYGKLTGALGWDGQRELLDDHVTAYHTLAAISETWGDLDGAVRYLEWACELQPDDVDAHTRLGALYSCLGDQGRAIFQLQGALGLDPARLETRYQLYAVYRRSGMAREATEQLRLIKAGEDPAALAAFFAAHGQAHFESHELDDAADDYTLALQLAPDTALWYALLGDVYHVADMARQGLETWLRGLWVTPAPVLEERVLTAAEDPALEPLVVETYRGAMGRWPDRGAYPLGLARLALRQGDEEAAAAYLARAAAVDPGLVEAHELLANLYQSAGLWSQVAESLRAGLTAARAGDVLYRCRTCGLVSAQGQPRCFRCGRWHDFEAVTRGALAAEVSRAESPPPDLRERATLLWGRFVRQLAGPTEDAM
ncbi:MAG: tetratricopeptide repeat protein [Chloroflexi bacterium]|nr:tetratricopeptide repeat protein [Chloroflexota bacterium]MBU1747278.1 tetratricopeptide repeat protein [Chloroflexota bacterium]